MNINEHPIKKNILTKPQRGTIPIPTYPNHRIFFCASLLEADLLRVRQEKHRMRRQCPKDGLVKGSEGDKGFALGPVASASRGNVELRDCMCVHNYVTTCG